MTTSPMITASQAAFDPLDETFRSDPFPTLSALREQSAAFRDAVLPAIHVLRHAECQEVLQDSETFTNDFAWAIQPYLESMPELAEELPALLLAEDGATHHRQRSLVNKAFGPAAIRRIEQHVDELTGSLVAQAVEQGDCDFIEAVAYPLPVQVIAEMLGLPTADREWFKDWSARFVGGFGTAVFTVPDQTVVDTQVATLREMHDYLRPLVEERRASPTDDLLSGLVQAEEAGDKLTMPELMQTVAGLLVAGHETTTNLIAHTLVELHRNPAEFARVRADRSLIPTAVEEAARMGGPTMAILRVAATDTEIGGEQVAEDEMLFLWAGAAHRDPAVFDQPDTFDAGRDPNPHFSFSRGPHYCLGAQLARVEVRTLLGHLLESTSALDLLTDQPPLHPSPIMRGYTELPVRLTSR